MFLRLITCACGTYAQTKPISNRSLKLLKAVKDSNWNEAHRLLSNGHYHALALHVAVQTRYLSMIDLLIRISPELVYIRNDYGCTPLHIAMCVGDAKIAIELVRAGAPINSLDYGMKGALNYAAEQLNVVMVKKLVRCGASVTQLYISPLLSALQTLHARYMVNKRMVVGDLYNVYEIACFVSSVRALKRIVYRKRCIRAALTIQRWWIPICYNPYRVRRNDKGRKKERSGHKVVEWQTTLLRDLIVSRL